jgi:phage terminase small subunit
MTAKLTPKQEKFCRVFMLKGNASEAYRQSYDCQNMKNTTINRKASELMVNGKVTARISEFQLEAQKAHDVTVESITKELDENRQYAIMLEQSAAMNSATMGKAKLHGLIVEKKDVKITRRDELLQDFLDNLGDTTGLPGEHGKAVH